MRDRTILLAAVTAGVLAACGGGEPEHAEPAAGGEVADGVEWVVRDTVLPATFDAAGVAKPFAEATLSTKLMGQVVEVVVREGDVVAASAPLVRIDAADLAAKRAQVEASIREAEAVVRDAETQASRMRALYEEDAAPKAQLDAAETGLERARAGLATARAAAAEVDATAEYSVVRAPFAGIVTTRFVDPGDFAAPGAPLVSVLDARRLRIAATAAPDAVRRVSRGDTVPAMIEGEPVVARVEGVVPGTSGTLYTVNAVVDNRDNRYLPGSAATLRLPQGERSAVVVPRSAVVRQGDLTGVRVRTAEGSTLRWVRLGSRSGDLVEVLGGLETGDVVLVPANDDAVAGGDRVGAAPRRSGQRAATAASGSAGREG